MQDMLYQDMLYLEDVCVSFGSSFSLERINFQVMKGEIFGFLGPSGAGKTTTIKLLTGQLRKDSGKIRIMGKDISDIVREDYANVGILSDTNGLYERMSIADNLYFFAEIRGTNRSKADELLKKMHLYEQRKTLIKKSSKGMRQRTVLAAAVLHSPALLFLDEPTNGLDPATILEVHKILLDLNKEGTTIFLTTHNMEEADKLCGRIGIINQGKIVTSGSPQALKLQYAKPEIRILTADRKIVSVKKDVDGIAKILELAKQDKIMTVHSVEPNLEEIFIELTGREF